MSNAEFNILVVDDDAALCKLLEVFLGERQVTVSVLPSANDLTRIAADMRPSMIVLDVMMPGTSGLNALRDLRASGNNTPVIMLTAKDEGVDRVIGLEMGADDYLGKPFLPQELWARISAVRRRQILQPPSGLERSAPYRFGKFVMDFEIRTLLYDGQPRRLTPSEFNLLAVLSRHPMQTLSRSKLLGLWYGAYVEVTERGIDVPIWRLRRLIEEDPSRPKIIQTMRGIGYMFVPPRDQDD